MPEDKRSSFINSGAKPVSTTVTLNSFSQDRVSIVDDLVTVDFDFPLLEGYATNKAQPTCVVYMTTKTGVKTVNCINIVDNLVTFGLPVGGISALSRMYIGYSNGVFGGYSDPYYSTSNVRIFNDYDTGVFQTEYITYPGYDDRSESVIVKFKLDSTSNVIVYVGHPDLFVEDTYTVGGVL